MIGKAQACTAKDTVSMSSTNTTQVRIAFALATTLCIAAAVNVPVKSEGAQWSRGTLEADGGGTERNRVAQAWREGNANQSRLIFGRCLGP